MATKILFLDENYRPHQNYSKELVDQGFDLIDDANVEDVADAVESCRLLIFAAPNDANKVGFLKNLLKRFPKFPIIYLFTNDTALEKDVKQDQLHKVIRPLTQKRHFIDTVSELLSVPSGEEGKILDGENTLVVSRSTMFESLDLEVVVDQTLKFFSNHFKADNISWISKRQFDNNMTKGAPSEDFHLVSRDGVFQGVNEEKPSAVVSKIKQFLIEGQKGSGDVIFAAVRPGVCSFLSPIMDKVKNEPLAYLFFDSVVVQSPNATMGKISEHILEFSRHINFSHQYWLAQNQAFIDDLTELYNQRYLPKVLSNEIARANRNDQKFSILFLDVDYFKTVNDTRGHWIGSRVLVELGRLILDSTRSTDYAFRYGGDEFVVVLVDTDVDKSELVAERLRKKIEDTTFSIDGINLNVTVSIGVAVYPDHARTSEQIIQIADQAMYYGKNKSRNIVFIAS